MLTATIGQLSSASSLSTADYIEIEASGVSKKADISMIGDALTSTSAQSAAGSSNDVFITPATLRAGINAETAAPIYACRAWAQYDAGTTSSSISATYSRASGSTTILITATAHGCISGNVQYLDFTTGTASDGSYVVTVLDANTFNVTTIASTATSGNVTLKRCVIKGSGNISSVVYATTGGQIINYAVPMNSSNYSIVGSCSRESSAATVAIVGPSITGFYDSYCTSMYTKDDAGTDMNARIVNVSVFC